MCNNFLWEEKGMYKEYFFYLHVIKYEKKHATTYKYTFGLITPFPMLGTKFSHTHACV